MSPKKDRKFVLEEASTEEVFLWWLSHAEQGCAIQRYGHQSWRAITPRTASYFEAENAQALAEKLKPELLKIP